MSKDALSVVGVIHPDSLYTTEGVLNFAGLGNDSLRLARSSGMVHPLKKGKRLYFKGSELIRWIESTSSVVVGSQLDVEG